MATNTSHLQLTKPDYAENADISVINGNMDLIDAEIWKRSRVYNLLDNSDFEIAQAGYGGKHGTVIYAADRWPQNDSTVRTYSKVTHNGHGALQCTSATRIQQKFTVFSGEDYTAAVIINGTLYILNFNADGAGHGHSSGQLYLNYINANTYMFVLTNLAASAVVSEPVVYRGTYTAETLPHYVPKGYATEMLECQRYYFRTKGHGYGYTNTTTSARLNLPVPVQMRATPSIDNDNLVFTIQHNGTLGTVTSYAVAENVGGTVRINLTAESEIFTRYSAIAGYASDYFGLSADL